MTMGADDDEVRMGLFDVFKQLAERIPLGKTAGGTGNADSDLREELPELEAGAAFCLLVEAVHDRKFVGSEAIGGVGWLRLDDVEQLQACAKGFREADGLCNDLRGGIGKINCDYDVFHGM